MSSGPPRLQAPTENGRILAVPSLSRIEPVLQANRRLFQHGTVAIAGRSLADLRVQARAEAVAAARAYLREAGQVVPDHGTEYFLLGGHQPELFHPGVWLKNFALAGLAEKLHGTALNLVVDNDIAKSTVLRLPARSIAADMGVLDAERDRPWLLRLPIDVWNGDAPYEERHVRDEALFATLVERAEGWTRDWGFTPLLPKFWSEARKQAGRTTLLGERLAATRRAFEHAWGCRNLEAPISQLCRGEAFAWLAGDILCNLPRFHDVFNRAICAYRKQHGIRSRNHPMPELACEDHWLEAPFWTWQAGNVRRRRLFVQSRGSTLHLRAGADILATLDSTSPVTLVKEFNDLQAVDQGKIRIRTRALTTTLLARLLIADVFMHGLGGGLYDAITDEVIRGYYGMMPPSFLVVTGTLRLPFAEANPDFHRSCNVERRLRELRHNPQAHAAAAAIGDLVEEKEGWIARAPSSRADRRERAHALRQVNRKLAGYLDEPRKRLEEELARCQRERLTQRILGRRDFAFCLYPETELRSFISRLRLGER